MTTTAQIEKMVEARNAAMKAEGNARGAYFAATHERAASIGNGAATQSQYDRMMALKAKWDNIKAAA
tara:strand:- start:398 stop:598 length:201 start_codon:yes stop_codon:yes gene_type:complete